MAIRYVVAAACMLSSLAIKIYAGGSGKGMLSLPSTVSKIIELSKKSNNNASECGHVLYVGTADYDAQDAQDLQTNEFAKAGCTVSVLKVAYSAPGYEEMRVLFELADIIVASGGNTLFAGDRWKTLGIDKLMKQALQRGTVMTGGSAGAIVWFDGGHSDSMNPTSYKNPPGPLLNPNLTAEGYEEWAYVRVPGLGFLQGLVCPHYDMTESNNALRATDMTRLLQGHMGEQGLGIDNWAGLVVDGDRYAIDIAPNQNGSVGGADGATFVTDRSGRPGAWTLRIDGETGELVRTLVPPKGYVADLLPPAKWIVQPAILAVARAQNPDDGVPPGSPGSGSD